MTTAQDLIDLAWRDSGVYGTGQTPSGDDANDTLRRLNMMLRQWSRRRWLVYHLVETALTCDGSQSYTVGLGGEFNIARPDRIEAAFIRQVVPASPTPVDWSLTQLNSYEDYARISIKQLASAPSQYFFYDSGYPLGALYPWPIPNANFALHILTKAVLPAFASVAEEVVLPPEYEEAIYLNLAVRLRMAYRLKPDPVLIGFAKAALNTLRRANVQPALLVMPRGIRRGPAYNIFSDQGY